MSQQAVRQLISERARVFNESTRQIFQQIEHVTDAVEQYLDLSTDTLVWEEATLTSEINEAKGGTLILTGSLYSGASTSEPTNAIHFGIPMDMLDWGTQDVLHYLQTQSEYLDDSSEFDEQDEHLLEHDEDDELVEPSAEQLDTPQSDSQTDWSDKKFDLSQLSQEQRDKLEYFNMTVNSSGVKTN